MSALELVEGRLVLDDRVVPGRLWVEDGRIAAIEPNEHGAAGPYVTPGFVDIHVHGWGGHDAMADTAALDGMARALLRRGVTSFLPTAVTASLPALAAFGERVRGWMPGAPIDGAQPLGFNLEGPFLAMARRGAQDPDHIRDPAGAPDEQVAALLEGMRVMTIAPERPGALELIARLAGLGVAPSLGHSAATAAEARAGYAAGAVTTTHLFNAMTGIEHRSPGLALVALTTDEAYVELIADGHHVDPALWPLVFRAKPANRVVLVSDAIALAGTDLERGRLGGVEVEIHGDRCTLAGEDRLAGSLIALDSAVRNLARSGIGLPRAVAAASRDPAALLGAADRGRLMPGLRADLVELDEDLAVRRVMRGGAWFEGPVPGSAVG